MNNSLMNGRKAAKIGFFLSGILGFTGSSYGIDRVALAEKFELVIAEKSFGGEEILAGRTNAAIEKMLETASLSSKYNWNTNLCAAYTAQGNYSIAERHCGLSLKLSKTAHYGVLGNTRSHRAKKDNRAIALNNMGVMYALQGNPDAAREHFESVSNWSKRLSATADRNINALELRQKNPAIASS